MSGNQNTHDGLDQKQDKLEGMIFAHANNCFAAWLTILQLKSSLWIWYLLHHCLPLVDHACH